MKTCEYHIRKYRNTDLSEIHCLIEKTIDISYTGLYPPEAISAFRNYHAIDRIRRDALDGYTVVAHSGKKIIGTGTLIDNSLRRVFICPGYQHLGIGVKIVSRLEREAIHRGAMRLELGSSLFARDFWLHRGYTVQHKRYLRVDNNKRLYYYDMAKSLTRNSM